jgi:dolichol-phosphate mannosyltransferase
MDNRLHGGRVADIVTLDRSGRTALSQEPSIALTIVVPTFNESANVGQLVERLDAALPGVAWEVIFVDDDSPDQTAEVASRLAQHDPRVRRLLRIGRRGLASACIEGLLSSSAPHVAVIDGDLQHDETALSEMLVHVRDGGADLAVGTRYAKGGSVGAWNGARHRMSRFATRLSRAVTGVELSDPMSGFFLMRRDAFLSVAHRLSGLGFKILFDIVASAPKPLAIVEVPYTFRERQTGESKLDSLALWEFLMLLLDKAIGRFVPVRFATFAVVGSLGVAVHFAVLTLLFRALSVGFTVSQTTAAAVAMVSNYILNNAFTYRDRRRKGWRWLSGLASFMIACSLGAFANVGIASYLYSGQTKWPVAALMGILVGAVWNYAVTSVYTWKR